MRTPWPESQRQDDKEKRARPMRRRSQACRPDVVLDAAAAVGCESRRAAFRAEQLRKPRLPAADRAPGEPGAQVLPAGALVGRADPRGARIRRPSLPARSCRSPRPFAATGARSSSSPGFASPCFPGWPAARRSWMRRARARCWAGPSRACIASAHCGLSRRAPRLSVERLGVGARQTVLGCGLLPERGA